MEYGGFRYLTKPCEAAELREVDMSLIRGIGDSPRQQRLVGSRLAVCEGELGIAVVCEGVETERERDTLSGLGATLLQGYFLGRPVAEFVVPKLDPAAPQEPNDGRCFAFWSH